MRKTATERGLCMHNIFDSGVTIARTPLYQSAVAPDLFPEERPMRVENWNPEDQVAYCGGEYAKAAYRV
jgi:hypothetical protein